MPGGGGSSSRTQRCPAGRWTNVIWWGGVIFWSRRYRVNIGAGNRARWRRYGVGVPPYWEGSFTGSETFTWYPWDPYIRVDIKPDRDVDATIS